MKAQRLAELEEWMQDTEGKHFEFKEAKRNFPFDDLAEYCCALSNEGGGRVILGVTDKRPRRVVGSNAFPQPEQAIRSLQEKLHIGIEAFEIRHPDGRVLVFVVPSRPFGLAVQYKARYLAREGDKLVPMRPEALRAIFSEAGHDFSGDVCPDARFGDLDPAAVEDFRKRWIEKSASQKPTLKGESPEQLLRDAELLDGDRVTYAALILFGTHAALGRFLPQAEVVFEYRSSEATGPAQQRKEYRQGFFAFYEDLWQGINLRNDSQHYQNGLFVLDIPTLDERSVREAIMNAVSHRNYQLSGSVFVRQYPRRLSVDSPGGLPLGITLENILDRQSPRNRRIAEALARCGLVERAGQGMNLMFERSIRQGKARPDFAGTDEYNVTVTLSGEMRDPEFVHFLEKISKETDFLFNTQDFLVLDLIRRGKPMLRALQPRLKDLRDHGIIECLGRGRGTRYLLSRRFYVSLGKPGAYTRQRGLDREENKAILLRHLTSCGEKGCAMAELQQVLPSRSRGQIKWLLLGLQEEGLVHLMGANRGARWYISTSK